MLSFGAFVLDPARHLLLERGKPVRLGSRALLVLLALAERRGELVTKAELTAAAWPDTHVEDVNLRVHITALRKALGDGQDGARTIVNVPGRGYRFVAPVTEIVAAPANDQSPQTVPAPPCAEAPRRQAVPNLLTRLIGRTDVVGLLAAQLDITRMVSIVGPGGMGKTSVALAVAHHRMSADDELYFVDLASVTDPDLVPAALAGVLSIPTLADNPTAAVTLALRTRDLTILLDNCEHVIDAVAAIAEAILKTTARVRLLATSREPLRVEGERIHRLAALAAPPAQPGLTAAAAMGFPAIQLFVERAAAMVESFTLSDADAPILAEICHRLDGIPLAVELAAARIDLFNLQGLARGLNDRFALLTRGRRTALPRHQTLRATLDWSYNLLPAPEQRMLRHIGAFAATFTLGDLAAMTTQAEPGGTLESLTSLVAKSMLAADVTREVVRYRLLETTREYALEKLREAGEAALIFRRHANHVGRMLRRDEAALTQQAWLVRAAGVRDDLNAALDRSFAPGGDVASGIALTVSAIPVWFRLSCLAEHRSTIDRALAALAQAGQPDAENEMVLQSAQGLNLYFTDGPARIVMDRLQHALALARQTGADSQTLPIIWMLSFVSGNAGDYRGELAFAQAYDAAAPGSTDILAPARAHRMLARSLHDLGRHGEARSLIEQALTATRTRQIFARLNAYDNDHWIASRAIRTRILWMQGLADDALAELEGCLRDALAIDHAQSICWALTFHLCPVAIWCGRLDLARRLVGILLVQSRKTFAHWHVWGRVYDGVLTQLETGSSPLAPADPNFPAQGDLLGTLAAALATQAAEHRVAADPDNWCAPEILRARAIQLQAADPLGAEHLLHRAGDLAARQGALSWELRIATSLAQLYRGQNRADLGVAVLSPVLARLTQGFTTQDVQEAATLLRDLETHVVLQWPAARKQRLA